MVISPRGPRVFGLECDVRLSARCGSRHGRHASLDTFTSETAAGNGVLCKPAGIMLDTRCLLAFLPFYRTSTDRTVHPTGHPRLHWNPGFAFHVDGIIQARRRPPAHQMGHVRLIPAQKCGGHALIEATPLQPVFQLVRSGRHVQCFTLSCHPCQVKLMGSSDFSGRRCQPLS